MSKLTFHSRLCTNTLTSSRIRALESTPQSPKQTFVLRRLAHRGQDALRNNSLEPQVADPPTLRRRTTLRLRGIRSELTKTKITEVFSRFGNVKDCVITGGSNGKPTGDAFVEYYLPDHAEDALRASEVKGITIHGQPIDVATFKRSLTTVKPSRTLHVSEMPLDISLSQVKSFFECHGLITNVRFGRYPGSAYIDFVSMEVAQGAMQQYQATPFTMSDRVLTVYYAQPSFTVAHPEENHRAAATVPRLKSERRLHTPTSSVFVTKLAKPVLESDIREAFKSFGEVQSVALNYYEDRPSRTIAFVRFANITEAAAAIEAWQSGALQHLGQNLRMDYELDPTRRGNRPYHTLRLSGFSGGLPFLESIAEEFKESVWRVSEPVTDQSRKGKGASVGYVEFLTIDHATAALEALQGRIVNGDERLKVAYATPLKVWTLRSGVGERDQGAGEVGFGLEGGDDPHRTASFQALNRKDQWTRLEKIAKDLDKEWKPGDGENAKELVKELVEKRAQEKALKRQELLRVLDAARRKPSNPDHKPEQ